MRLNFARGTVEQISPNGNTSRISRLRTKSLFVNLKLSSTPAPRGYQNNRATRECHPRSNPRTQIPAQYFRDITIYNFWKPPLTNYSWFHRGNLSNQRGFNAVYSGIRKNQQNSTKPADLNDGNDQNKTAQQSRTRSYTWRKKSRPMSRFVIWFKIE